MEKQHLILKCSCQETKKDWFCDCYRDEIIFIKNQFYLLSIPRCTMESWQTYPEWMLSTLNSLKPKTKDYWDVWHEKSNVLNSFFNNKKDVDFTAKRYMMEINYLYHDNAKKEYAITMNVPFNNYVCSQEERDESFNSLNKYLERKKMWDHLPSLKRLHDANRFDIHDHYFIESTDKLIKQINKLNKK